MSDDVSGPASDGHLTSRSTAGSMPAGQAPAERVSDGDRPARGATAASWTARRLLPRRYSGVGLLVAAVVFCWSQTPSLLPRTALFQGVVSGLVAAIGYGLGILAARLLRRWWSWRPSRIVRWLVVTLAVAAMIASSVAGLSWQRQLHRLFGEPRPAGWTPLTIAAFAGCLFVLLVTIGRLLRTAARWVARPLERLLPVRIAGVVGAVIVALLIGGLLDRVLLRVALSAADQAFSLSNQETPPGVERPVSALRSGSRQSLARWDELGAQGRRFVAGGPTTAQLTAFSGRPALEPIRVYVGEAQDDDVHQRAATAVAELRRTGAFDRSVLCVVTTTGNGWVNRRAADSLEYLTNGDSAVVSLQYSYLPSALSLVLDSSRAEDAGRELFDQVYDYWSTLPPASQPRLLVYGESLGAYGGQAAFSGLGDLRNRADGVLWVGPPNFSGLWSSLVARRDVGSPERLPSYDAGLTVRFAATPSDAGRLPGPWNAPRVLYLQHASDPVVWWSPDLLWSRPAWLAEPRGGDVSPAMHWYPLVTFWQVTADMIVADAVPAGHGHNYADGIPGSWAALLDPSGWTAHDTQRLQRAVEG